MIRPLAANARIASASTWSVKRIVLPWAFTISSIR
jgi:hypothetical protein